MRSVQRDREREAELKLYLEWKNAKSKRRRDVALFGLWQRCEPTTKAVLKSLAGGLGAIRNEHITVPAWLSMHGLDFEEAHAEAFPAVLQAVKKFEPEQGTKFSTYAYKSILGSLSRAISKNDAFYGAQAWPDGLNEPQDPAEAEDVGACLWDLFELNPHNGGPGKYSDRGARLGSLNADTLVQIRTWLEENKERGIAAYGFGRWLGLRAGVGLLAFGEQMPPEARHTDYFANKAKDGLIPFQGVAIRTDGKTWDLDAPVRAEILENQIKQKRQTAKLLGIKWSTYKDLRKRMEKQGFSLNHFTTEELEAIALGNQGRSPES